jgi:hypothetical protein
MVTGCPGFIENDMLDVPDAILCLSVPRSLEVQAIHRVEDVDQMERLPRVASSLIDRVQGSDSAWTWNLSRRDRSSSETTKVGPARKKSGGPDFFLVLTLTDEVGKGRGEGTQTFGCMPCLTSCK